MILKYTCRLCIEGVGFTCYCCYVGAQVQEKLGLSVRSALNEQLLKLQVKHSSELELLDDLR